MVFWYCKEKTMLENVQTYLSKQGVKYIKPEKAEPHQV
ncbi:Hypothetical protein MNA02_307 [Streptococcus thermophilus]|nr:hypothetical protein STND_0312 [Streptococcus thermophilus ND03]AFJ82754.1 hypothetical protein Y1U_C0305 [Streptococcus thermophilus MN-ZLW-002]AKB96943.1 hypothetical protein SMQ301_0323 [Streptococcus thermophilus]AKH34592.1 Hypothetical protein MNA02_307 [Streptococcus thermophilus]AOZ58627.1 hypothetical protein BBD27_0543 [Streptococcus thermophilus]